MRSQFTPNKCIKCHHFIKFSSIKSMVQRKFIISCVNKKLWEICDFQCKKIEKFMILCENAIFG